MGRFEGKQLVKRKDPSYREGRCRIIRGASAWVITHKGRFVGERDTYVEAEVLSRNETGRLNAVDDKADALKRENEAERYMEDQRERAHCGERNDDERLVQGVGHTGPYHNVDVLGASEW